MLIFAVAAALVVPLGLLSAAFVPAARLSHVLGALMVLVAVGGCALAWEAAETPLGIGNHEMPDLSSKPNRCEAEEALEKRGIRWHDFRSSKPRSHACGDDQAEQECRDGIAGQKPQPGTRVGSADLVEFSPRASCSA